MSRPIRTMEEFASFAGVSRPTVSKYFNAPDTVSSTTRDAIELALKKSGFQPSLFAVNLNRRRSKIIGVIVPNPIDPFYSALTRRIELIANEAGFLAFVMSSHGLPELEDKAIQTFKSMNIAGAIIAPLGLSSHHDILARLGVRIPLIYMDSPLDETSDFVGTDNRQSIGLITDYLCRSGDAPCYFGMPAVNSNALARQEAYDGAMRRFGKSPQLVSLPDAKTWDFEKFAFDQTAQILNEGGFPTKTVLCANDRIAFGVIAAAFQLGRKVGHAPDCDLRVAGHDDHPLSRYSCPPITTVAQDYEEIGRLAIDLLLRKLDLADVATQNERLLLKAELMLRQSA